MALVEAPYENSLFSIQTDLNVDPKEITGGLPAPSLNPIKVRDTLIKTN